MEVGDSTVMGVLKNHLMEWCGITGTGGNSFLGLASSGGLCGFLQLTYNI